MLKVLLCGGLIIQNIVDASCEIFDGQASEPHRFQAGFLSVEHDHVTAWYRKQIRQKFHELPVSAVFNGRRGETDFQALLDDPGQFITARPGLQPHLDAGELALLSDPQVHTHGIFKRYGNGPGESAPAPYSFLRFPKIAVPTRTSVDPS